MRGLARGQALVLSSMLVACSQGAAPAGPRPGSPGAPQEWADAASGDAASVDMASGDVASIDAAAISPDTVTREDASPDVVTAGVVADGALPLSTCGRWLVDAQGRRVKLAGVNWYGANDVKLVVGGLDKVSLASVAGKIRELGFNSVRLPFSNEMLHSTAAVTDAVA
ncbi:MAG TPA: hypothetical protein VNO55_27535, partial [Polyangia bacterium]|nr:hypothetical protein [Polyangia bacterium]